MNNAIIINFNIKLYKATDLDITVKINVEICELKIHLLHL